LSAAKPAAKKSPARKSRNSNAKTAGIVAGAAAAVAVGLAATVGRKQVANAASAVAKKVRGNGKAKTVTPAMLV
jgi:hypothetical protein